MYYDDIFENKKEIYDMSDFAELLGVSQSEVNERYNQLYADEYGTVNF